MSGVVDRKQSKDPKKGAYNEIEVFNQQTRNDFRCRVRTDPKDKKRKLLSKTGNTELNWILPVNII